MYKVLVVEFDSEQQADEGVKALKNLDTEGSITLHGQAVIVKDAEGRPTFKKSPDEGSLVSAVGFVTGTTIGVPGEPAGLMIAADYLEKVTNQLEPGKVVVVAEIQEEQASPVDGRMEAAGGAVSRQDVGELLYDQVERDLKVINAQLDSLNADLDKEGAGTEARLQARIEGEKAEMQETRERVRTRLEATRKEAEAKLAELKQKAASADAERKQQLEKRLAEVQEDLKMQTAKLRQALENVPELPGRTGRGEDSGPPKAMDADVAENGAVSGGTKLIERVYEGMTVVDADGKEIGKVELVRMGDPEAGSLEGQWRDEVKILDSDFVEGEPDLPRELRHSLLRRGFIKVDRRGGILGIGEKKHYTGADMIAGVSGDRVTLAVTEAQLPDNRNQDGPIIH